MIKLVISINICPNMWPKLWKHKRLHLNTNTPCRKIEKEKKGFMRKQNLMKAEVGAMFAGELLDPLDGNLRRIVQIIDDHCLVSAEQQLQHRVGSDVPGATCHEYTRRHFFRWTVQLNYKNQKPNFLVRGEDRTNIELGSDTVGWAHTYIYTHTSEYSKVGNSIGLRLTTIVIYLYIRSFISECGLFIYLVGGGIYACCDCENYIYGEK